MKIQRIILGVILILSTSLLFAQEEKVKKIKYKGEEWLETDAEKLYHQPDEYVHKNVYFEINHVSAKKTNSWELTPGKRYLKFYIGHNGHSRYLWVEKKEKGILEIMYDFDNSKDMAIVFARVKRKKDKRYYHVARGYEYFLIAEHIVKKGQGKDE